MVVYSMDVFIVISVVSLSICVASFTFQLYRLVTLGKPTDYSQPAGDITKAIRYSFTGGMSPAKKESAYLHLPTYTAGILYHLGTFLSLVLFIFFLIPIEFPLSINLAISIFLCLTSLCGFGILVKRYVSKDLSSFSNPDDYISNFLVTGFQVMTLIQLHFEAPAYYVLATVLFLYMPLGKLRHLLYFFAARYHLGIFYGRRGVWPPKNTT
jgi:hypothetical protein